MMQDIKQALHQGTTDESLEIYQSFVDFVMGGLIEDELELYQSKKRIKRINCAYDFILQDGLDLY